MHVRHEFATPNVFSKVSSLHFCVGLFSPPAPMLVYTSPHMVFYLINLNFTNPLLYSRLNLIVSLSPCDVHIGSNLPLSLKLYYEVEPCIVFFYRELRGNPSDVELWLELINTQDGLRQQRTEDDSSRLFTEQNITEKKIAIITQAITKNPSSLQLKVSLSFISLTIDFIMKKVFTSRKFYNLQVANIKVACVLELTKAPNHMLANISTCMRRV